MLNYPELVATIAIQKYNPQPNGIIITSNKAQDKYDCFMNFTAFNGCSSIDINYRIKLVTTSNLNELILNPNVQGIIYGVTYPFFADEWSHTILTNNIVVVANCIKSKNYIIDTDFKTGHLSFINGYVACIY